MPKKPLSSESGKSSAHAEKEAPITCERCYKIPALCICADIQPRDSRLKVLILQHPQEPDKILGSARLANLALANSELRVGLSWPNLKRALEGKKPEAAAKAAAKPANRGKNKNAVDPSDPRNDRWGVLYLGSGIKSEKRVAPGLHFVHKSGAIANEPPPQLDGIVVIDGTWSQAKTLWWRNAWLLKLKRVVLVPTHPSLYKELRREPRRECLSTIETIADALGALGEPAQTPAELRRIFTRLLDAQRARLVARKERAASGNRHRLPPYAVDG
jgi:DTW domain-containing protein YfiP